MSKPTDTRPHPGDMVTVRGTKKGGVQVWQNITEFIGKGQWPTGKKLKVAGFVNPGAIGIVVCVCPELGQSYTYVLWSGLGIVGWVQDGYLRKV